MSVKGVLMYWKNAFINTLREEPADAELISHKLMIRASMIQKVASGIYSYLPLGLRVIRKIEDIIRREMDRCGVAEILMPTVVPSELWKESGRWQYYGSELLRFTDRKNNEFCLGPTHEEVVVDIARHAVRSYRDLPLSLYQIQGKFRDEVRPRYGLMRGREFIMKDAYSFHNDEACLDKMYWKMYEAYTNIFNSFGLKFRPVEADSGTIGGDVTHEFHVLADSGEDTIIYCDSCDYAANIEKAESRCETIIDEGAYVNVSDPEDVKTPGKCSIEEVSSFLEIKPFETVKMLIYSVNDGDYYAATCIRGDLELNDVKFKNALGADNVAIPDDTELVEQFDLPVGFLGPRGFINKNVKTILYDNSVRYMSNCVCGANKKDYHTIHILPSRDFNISSYVDLSFAAKGDGCPRCEKGVLNQCKGIEVGQVFKLGIKYSSKMKMTYLDENGDQQTPAMGCYGIGVGRTAAAAVEQNYDKNGIIWPGKIAPYEVAILCLDPMNSEAVDLTRKIHDELGKNGIDVLVDDRDERPGVKFKDADLIGFPVRVVIGARGLKESIVEVKLRTEQSAQKIPVDNSISCIMDLLK